MAVRDQPDREFRRLTLDEVNSKATEDGRFSHVRLLGKGTFGSVFLSVDTQNKRREVTMKAISIGQRGPGLGKMVPNLRQSLEDAKTLGKLRHGHIVGYETIYFSLFDEEVVICIVTEYFARGSLDSYLRAHGPPTRDTTMKFCRQIAKGVEHLHKENFIHHNIKPDNMLLDGEQNIKIADFGIARAAWGMNVAKSSSGVTLGSFMSKLAGTSAFVAPEVIDDHYSDAADVFSVALVYASMADPERFTFTVEARGTMITPVCTAAGCSNQPLGRLLRNSTTKRTEPASNLLGIDSKTRPSLTKLLDAMLLYDYTQRPKMFEVSARLAEMHSEPLPVVLDSAGSSEVDKKSCCACLYN